MGLLEEEALQAEEGGDLQVVVASGKARLFEDRGVPLEGSLRMVRADAVGGAQPYGGEDAGELPVMRLRGLEPPLAGGAEVGRGLEVLR